MSIPEEALPHCIAAIVTGCHADDNVPNIAETLSAWVLHKARQNPGVVKAVLKEAWILGTTKMHCHLPWFYHFRQDAESQQFLISLSVDVL